MRKDIVISERIDKNGTKHQEVETNCDRCGGAGSSDKWILTGKVCYKCWGSGRMTVKRKLYTPEHEEKLRKRREQAAKRKLLKAMEQAEKRNAEVLKTWGYHNGSIYVVLGDTYKIKDELKEAGARWGGNVLGWFFSEKPINWETCELDVEKLVWYNNIGEVHKKDFMDYKDYVKEQKRELEPQSEWVGEAGDKVELELEVVNSFWFEFESPYHYGTSSVCVNKLRDNSGNVFIWKTGRDLKQDADEQGIVKLKGTIKEHNSYNDEKQTVLTRCRVKNVTKSTC